MKNIRVKQMICDVLDIKHSCEYQFGYYFDRTGGLCESFINGLADSSYEDVEKVRHNKPVVLTGDQLRAIRNA